MSTHLFVFISSFLCSCFLIYVAGSELCNFDLGTCHWNIEPPWNVVAFALLPGFNGFGTKNIKSDGPFLLAQGKYGSIQSSRSTSQPLIFSNHMRILAYQFQRRGSAHARIFLRNSTTELLLDSITEMEGENDRWKRRSVIIPPVIDDVTRIVFQCENIQSSEDVIAIDDIDLAVPENVMWSGQDSKLFTEHDIRQREIRRSSKALTTSSCQAIKCQFRSTTCKWKTSNIQLLPTKIVNEGSGEATLQSEPIRVPAGARLFIQMFDSSTSQTTILTRQIGSMKENEIWKKNDNTKNEFPISSANGNGWNRFSISLEQSAIPVIFIIRSVIGSEDFVAFSSIDLIDKESNSLGCDPISTPIQPHSDAYVRLTALQNLKISPIEKLLFQPPISTVPSLIGNPLITTVSPLFSFNLDYRKSIERFEKDSNTLQLPSAVLPIAPAQVSARGVPLVHFSSPVQFLPLQLLQPINSG